MALGEKENLPQGCDFQFNQTSLLLKLKGELIMSGYQYFYINSDGEIFTVRYISQKNLEEFTFELEKEKDKQEIQLNAEEAKKVFLRGWACFPENKLAATAEAEEIKKTNEEEDRIKRYEELKANDPLRYGKSDNWIKCVMESEVKALQQLEENQEKSEVKLQQEVREKLMMLYPHLRKRKMFKEA